MPRVAIEHLEPGMVTAAPVTSASGAVLAQAGTALTPALLARLGDLGIASVVVDARALSPEARAARLADIDARFAAHESNDWMQALKAIVIRLQAGGEGGGPHA